MKFIIVLFFSITMPTAMILAQTPTRIFYMDKKELIKSNTPHVTDTIYLKKKALKKAKGFTILFEHTNQKIFKRNTWLENENEPETATYTYSLPAPNGSITIPANTVKTLLKGTSRLQIWTSLLPVNNRMMVRQTRELIYTILID